MQLDCTTMAHWPPLAWLAECPIDDDTILVYHGNWVETRKDWFCEAVWAGDFPAGDFDKTDIVSGTGTRIRDTGVWFVSSGSNINRLHSLSRDGAQLVSNSLICLLAWADACPDLDYPQYSADYAEYRNAVFDNHTIVFPTSAGSLRLTYVANLLWDGEHLTEQDKPYGTRSFGNFSDYWDFLQSCMQRFAANASHHERSRPFKMLCGLSNGYDSPTVAALAHTLEGFETFTLGTDQHGTDDSGEAIATALGLPCHVLKRDTRSKTPLAEVPFLAASGSIGDLAFKPAETLLRGSVLLTGFGGDVIWDKNTPLSAKPPIGDGSMLGSSEYRLWTGYINCAVPYWGIRQLDDVIRISNSAEMSPWDIGGNYTRPICRRIVENAAVPRFAFGYGKRGVSVAPRGGADYLSPPSLKDLLAWLEEQRRQPHRCGITLPRPAVARLLDRISIRLTGIARILDRMCRRRGFRWLAAPVRVFERNLTGSYYHHNYCIHWAIDRAKRRYKNYGHAGPPEI
jgi:hypothetical protein